MLNTSFQLCFMIFFFQCFSEKFKINLKLKGQRLNLAQGVAHPKQKFHLFLTDEAVPYRDIPAVHVS